MALVHLIAGARPNFMKIAPLVRAIEARNDLNYTIVHTGQHYDRAMNDVFFEELGIPEPAVFMGAGGGSHADQTGKIMLAFEQYCNEHRPDAVLVVGDVNSTLACAIVAKKSCIPLGHIEAGLRSGDMAMPEEINRLVTDSISDWFFVTEPSGVANLRREGKTEENIHYVGHVMVDNLFYQLEKLSRTDTSVFETTSLKERLLTAAGRYGVMTLHRPSNVDDSSLLLGIAEAVSTIAAELPIVFPMHPRTAANFERFGIDLGPNVTIVGPQPYMPFLNLWKDAALVLTDSGGLQEETTALGIPCLTIRDNTERPVTVDEGTNLLVGTNPPQIIEAARTVLQGESPKGRRPNLWDGRSAERIVDILVKELL